jgi:hypothetical protein
MKKMKLKSKPIKKTIRKVRISKRNFYILFWTVLLFILTIPLLVFIQGRQDLRERAATVGTCIPSGGTCKPVGNCGSAESDAGEKDCSSDGSLTCCVPQSVGCLGSTNCNPTPTQQPIAPSPVIPTDTPMFNGFVSTVPQPSTNTNQPTQTPLPSNEINPTDTPAPSISTNPSTAPSQALPSISLTTTPGNGTIDNNLLTLLLDLLKKILDLFSSLLSGIGGHHSGNSSGHSHHDKD